MVVLVQGLRPNKVEVARSLYHFSGPTLGQSMNLAIVIDRV